MRKGDGIVHTSLLLTIFIAVAAIFFLNSHAQADELKVGEGINLTINGAIGPAGADYLIRGIHLGEKNRSPFVILQMDTPGGLDKSMRDIIKTIIASTVPIITYVSPSGSRAASAGTYIMYASHVAAMAPGTNLGAATPVSIGGVPSPGGEEPTADEKDKKESKDKKGAQKTSKSNNKSAMEKKVLNDAVAYIKGLAEIQGRNSEWAQKAVTEAASLSAKDALAINVIDLMADDVQSLLKKIDGRMVKVAGKEFKIQTKGKIYVSVDPDWRSRFLAVITDPSVAYILFLIGMYGLFFEFSNPGVIVPGVAGAICIILALYAFQMLPINYAGLGLILLGIIFMLMEAFVPSFGALGIGGIIAFVAGSVLLINPEAVGFGIPWQLILFMAMISAVFFSMILSMAVKARKRQVVIGHEALIGQRGIAIEDFEGRGQIKLGGEIWMAQSDKAIKKDQQVTVKQVEGLTIIIE